MSDAEKIKEGAEYVLDEFSEQPRLEFTQEQVDAAREEMGHALEQKLSHRTPREVMIAALRNFQTEFDESMIEQLEEKLSKYQNIRDETALAYTIARSYAVNQFRARERIEREKQKEQTKVADRMLEEERKKREMEEFNIAKKEFWPTVEKMIAEHPQATKLREMMGVLFDFVFEGMHDDELAQKYAGTTRNVRDKQRQRARIHLSNSEHTSPILKKTFGLLSIGAPRDPSFPMNLL